MLLGIICCGPIAEPRQDISGTEDEPIPIPKDRRALLTRLGLPARLLIGLGNDLPGPEKQFDFSQADIYSLPKKLDLHYVYLSGVGGESGWPDYNPDGAFVTMIANNDRAKDILPMFTLYQAAARGERNFQAFNDVTFMTHYWAGVRLLFTRLAATHKPALVHVEPDFWGFAQQVAKNDDPATVPVRVRAVVPECADLPDDVAGMGACIVRLARALAPNVALGFHASGFGAIGEPKRVARFLTRVGAREADFIVIETLDRDAGCFEVKNDPECTRTEGKLYWDETNRTSPNAREHLKWASTIHERLGLPLMWWQMPLGVPADAPGGQPYHYRDNRVRYVFAHPEEFVAAGGFAIAFGAGADHQTTVQTDGGQFARATKAYYERPVPITVP